MEVVAAFLVIVGVPCAVSAALGTVRVRRVARFAMIASVPLALGVVLYLGSPYSLDQLGVGVIAFLAAFGWVVGFAFSPVVRGLWRHTTRPVRPS
ncbi:MAG TPA: hypothetical protein VMJ49_01720 [Gaiellaceae bacterium]|nr:hypothetical protein [Gaiellaceae bacterium]